MRKGFIIGLALGASTICSAQINRVQNPSFEAYNVCPYQINGIAKKFCINWNAIDTNLSQNPIDTFNNTPLCAPEYYNACAPWYSGLNVPQTILSYHYARSGGAMVGFYAFYDEADTSQHYLRDYVQGQLVSNLIAGQEYCVSFYVYALSAAYGVNHIGAYFDDGSIRIGQDSVGCAQPQTAYTPQVFASSILTDTVNWTKVEGSFTASGTETFITIGNFSDKAHTAVVAITDTTGIAVAGTGWAYYMLDDVSVVPSDLPAYAGMDTTINQGDSVFIGRNEILPDIKWYANNVLLDSVNAGIWVKPNQTTTYVLEQSLCGSVKFDSVTVAVNVDTTIDTTEGVHYISYNKGFTIYPNPSGADFNIHCPVMANKLVNVTVSDISGRRIIEEQLLFEKNDKLISLHAVPGVYLIELTTGNSIKYLQKLIIK